MIYNKEFYLNNWKKVLEINGAMVFQHPKNLITIAFEKNAEKHCGYFKFKNHKLMMEYFNKFKEENMKKKTTFKELLKKIAVASL